MSNMAEYARIFETGVNDEWVEKRKAASSELEKWFEALSPAAAVKCASSIASSLVGDRRLPEDISAAGETAIQRHASSFVRSAEQEELQIKVVISAAVIDVVNKITAGGGMTSRDALAAAFWSALSFQRPLEQVKLEKLRQDLLVASRTRVLKVADATRKRRPIPPIGQVNISQDATEGGKVNNAFSRAIEPMITAMRDNADLDREELDFLWWLLSDRSDVLGEALGGMSNTVRAVVAGFDASVKLRKLPTEAHRNIVLRNISDGEPLSLTQLIEQLGERRTKLSKKLGSPPSEEAAVFPLIRAIATGNSDATPSESLTPSEWGARALLEGSIQHLQVGTAAGL